jgi:hypothetical protein
VANEVVAHRSRSINNAQRLHVAEANSVWDPVQELFVNDAEAKRM